VLDWTRGWVVQKRMESKMKSRPLAWVTEAAEVLSYELRTEQDMHIRFC
jgi:hypothetical protein